MLRVSASVSSDFMALYNAIIIIIISRPIARRNYCERVIFNFNSYLASDVLNI